MIGFEHSQWLWASLAALIPIIIHMIGRRPVKPIVIPSLMWLNTFQAKQRKRHKLRDLVVLLMRVLTILAIVMALAKPRFSSPSTTIIVDNHPAGWKSKQQWLSNLIDLLPEGTMDLHLRGGTELNGIQKDAVADVLAQWPSSLEPLPKVPGTLLSFGFSQLDSTFERYILPERREIQNTQLSYEHNKDALLFRTEGAAGMWRMFEGSQLALEWDSISEISVQLELLKKDQEYMVIHNADSLNEDNSISIVRRGGAKRFLFYRTEDQRPQAIQLSKVFNVDTVSLYTESVNVIAEPSIAAILYGFDFIPSPLSSQAQTVLVFPGLSVDSEQIKQPRPNLNHPFYATYFIGASTRNNWPQPESAKILEESLEPILVSDQGVLAGFQIFNSQRIYWQGFEIKNPFHPYYTALKQWSYKNNSFDLEQGPFLGEDAYSENITRLEEKLALGSMENKSIENRVFSGLQRDYSKIALLLALLFALIAVIFVKIF